MHEQAVACRLEHDDVLFICCISDLWANIARQASLQQLISRAS